MMEQQGKSEHHQNQGTDSGQEIDTSSVDYILYGVCIYGLAHTGVVANGPVHAVIHFHLHAVGLLVP